jgi:hypothetical protein
VVVPVLMLVLVLKSVLVLVSVFVLVFMLVLQGDLDLFLAATFTATISRIAGLGDTCSGCKG